MNALTAACTVLGQVGDMPPPPQGPESMFVTTAKDAKGGKAKDTSKVTIRLCLKCTQLGFV